MSNFNRNKDGMFNKDSSIYSVFYGTDAVLLEDELNESQWSIIEKFASIMKQQFNSGIMSKYKVFTTDIDNAFYIESLNQSSLNFLIEGYELKTGSNNPDSSLSSLSRDDRLIFNLNPAASVERNDLVYLEVWFQSIKYNEVIRKFGGDTTPEIPNTILDNRIQEETSRRIQLRWRLKYSQNELDLANIKAFDYENIVTSYNFNKFDNIYTTNIGAQRDSESNLIQSGEVYAIPLFEVNRKANDSKIALSQIKDVVPQSLSVNTGGGNIFVGKNPPEQPPTNSIWIDTN